ncbi:hypothetical protein EIN_174090 [Entamoeba invadens IP1]|uniref:Ku domain-containing protein n=1 Tax=Entamoeba invadens IP1 TaxID=370355 RepID=A0A0A1TW30_ENTIV|nr:hypothetical protein EIN_174090 [Entamoeba invadens IP1]ELP84734.1 hypothetical protein EIN_174090 [Entamoeba invadens IP1]|eukprot:XP_004184080.1 hypothetical protein EIN_174090 [Entamoeba invadens IP1]
MSGINLDLNNPNPPFQKTSPTRSSYNYTMTIIRKVTLNVAMYKTYCPEKFPPMSKISKIRKAPDPVLPVGERKKYYVLKNDPGDIEFGREDTVMALRYGKDILMSGTPETYNLQDGVTTCRGEKVAALERHFVIKYFVHRAKIPTICSLGIQWEIVPMDDTSSQLYKSLSEMMREKGVVGVAEFVLMKSYNVRNMCIVSTERGLVGIEMPWGECVIADGLSVASECDEEQKNWMEKYVDSLPTRVEKKESNPLLERVWNNILLKSKEQQIDFNLPLKEGFNLSQDEKNKAFKLFNWKEDVNEVQFEDNLLL